jgi:hypothetical protein
MPLPRSLQALSNRLRNAFHESVLFLTQTEKTMGVSPTVDFKVMTSVYLGDLATRASIDFLADQVAGQGFYTTSDETYQERSEDEKTAKQVVDDFCDRIGLDEVLQESARYLVGWGNMFWWVGNPRRLDFLKTVPLEIIKENGIKFDEQGNLDRIELDWLREPAKIDGSEVIHLPYNVMTASPLGVGILQSLCTPLSIGGGEVREAFYQIKGKIHSGMADTIYVFGGPNELYSLPGVTKERLQEFIALYKNAPKRGQRIFINPASGSKAEVTSIVAEGFHGAEFYIQTLEDEFILGLQTPLAKLVTKTGFTEASASAALEIAERRVSAIQRFLKRGVERFLFDRVVAAAGLDPVKAQMRLNWGMPEQLDYEKLTGLLSQLVQLAKDRPDVISADELRKILRDIAKLPLEENEQPEMDPSKLSKVLADKGAQKNGQG